jgi:hypothetical protein
MSDENGARLAGVPYVDDDAGAMSVLGMTEATVVAGARGAKGDPVTQPSDVSDEQSDVTYAA